MEQIVDLAAVWSQKVTGSTLYNIERPLGDNPNSGGGQLYIQVSSTSVDELLSFLGEKYPTNGNPIRVSARAMGNPSLQADLEIYSKSAGRLRIANQNRFRAARHPAWLPEYGFPYLEPNNCSTEAANMLLESISGLHIFLAFDINDVLWAGFVKGALHDPKMDQKLIEILSGNHRGGLWRFKEEG